MSLDVPEKAFYSCLEILKLSLQIMNGSKNQGNYIMFIHHLK